MKKLIFALLLLSLVSCGKDNDSGQNQIEQESQVKQDRKVVVYFAPLSPHLETIEKIKLWEAFKDIKDEDKGYWTIVSHAFDSSFALSRARTVEHFLRHHMRFDVVGVVAGKDNGELGTVDVTFSYYKEDEKK